jgi:hypothetical protein
MTTDAASPALPGWDEMSDLDKGAALLHTHKREYEGTSYAVDNYPARYFDHPALTALGPVGASGHAALVDPGDSLPVADYERLYDATLDADNARWQAEHAGGAS